MRCRRCSARSRCGLPAFAVLRVAGSRLAWLGHRIAGRHRSWTGFGRILADAGVATPPMLDWFHVAMRLQRPKQIADSLPADDPARGAANAVIVEAVERLQWRNWNGKAQDAQISIDRIRAVMHHFPGEPDQRRSAAPSRKLWTALRALDGYLTGQGTGLANDAERRRAGLRAPRSPKGRPTSWWTAG